MNSSTNSNSSFFDNQTFIESTDDQNFHEFATRLNIIQGIIYIPIFGAGLLNNFLTMSIIFLNRDMRTVTNCYLFNLAISDTMPLIVSLPFEISFFPIKLPFGDFGCRLRGLLAETTTTTSMLTISAFTIERYLAICHPLRTSWFSTIKRAIRVQILIWFIAILCSTPYLFLMKNINDSCLLDSNRQTFATICFHLSASLFFILPVLILCFLYALMARRLYSAGLIKQTHYSNNSKLKKDSSRLEPGQRVAENLSTPSLTRKTPSPTSQQKPSTSGLLLRSAPMKKSAFKMLFAVVIAFVICYAPFHIQRLITTRLDASHLSSFQKRVLTVFFFISGILYYIGSTVNPILYQLFSRKFRSCCVRTMKRLFNCNRTNSTLSNQRANLRASQFRCNSEKLRNASKHHSNPSRNVLTALSSSPSGFSPSRSTAITVAV